MAKGKPPTRRKAAAGKGKAKLRKPSIKKSAAKPGKGHNKPPKEEVLHAPRPFMASWQTDTTGQIARYTAQRRRTLIARTGIGTDTSKTPHAQAHDPAYLHQVMLKRIAALEKTIARLPTPPSDEIEEAKREIAKLRALPPVPIRLPTDAVQAQAKLRKFGEQVLSSLATPVVSAAVKSAVKELWASYGHQLIATAQSIGEWIASLPL